MSTPIDRRLPTPSLAEDLADTWSPPRARDLAYLPRPPREASPEQQPKDERGEAA